MQLTKIQDLPYALEWTVSMLIASFLQSLESSSDLLVQEHPNNYWMVNTTTMEFVLLKQYLKRQSDWNSQRFVTEWNLKVKLK